MQNLIAIANQNRSTAQTTLNDRSSRSHSVFQLDIQGENAGRDVRCKCECVCEGMLMLMLMLQGNRVQRYSAPGAPGMGGEGSGVRVEAKPSWSDFLPSR